MVSRDTLEWAGYEGQSHDDDETGFKVTTKCGNCGREGGMFLLPGVPSRPVSYFVRRMWDSGWVIAPTGTVPFDRLCPSCAPPVVAK